MSPQPETPPGQNKPKPGDPDYVKPGHAPEVPPGQVPHPDRTLPGDLEPEEEVRRRPS